MTLLRRERSPTCSTETVIIRTTREDTQREQAVAGVLRNAWNCDVVRTGYKDELDFWLVRDGKTEAVAELKNRKVESATYEDVFLSRHKWDALFRATFAHRIEGLFIVNFTDELRYIRLADIDATRLRMGGRWDRTDAPNDWEMMVMVPVAEMKVICRWESGT